MAIVTSSSKSQAFLNLGNLAFYDGWHPDYVYFKSLKNAHTAWYLNRGPSPWDAGTAGAIADQAIADATANTHLPHMTQEESEKHFLKQFQLILDFLKQAYAYERGNEEQFFKYLIDNTERNFSDAEWKKIKELSELRQILKDGQKSSFNYPRFMALINLLLQGFERAKLIADYEEKRLTTSEKIWDRLFESRHNQVVGLTAKQDKTILEQEIAAETAAQKLHRKITLEYVTTGQTTKKNKKTGKYALFGGKMLEEQVPKAIDRVLANWANTTLSAIIDDQEVVAAIAQFLDVNYPKNGDFSRLEAHVQQIIIQAVINIGLKNLKKILQNDLTEDLTAEVKHTLTTDQTLFDQVSQYNIHGLTDDFGRIVTDSELLHETNSTDEMLGKHATELYKLVNKLIQSEKKSRHGIEDTDSLLIKAMNDYKVNKNTTALSQAEEMITLVEEIQRIYQEANQLLDDWKATVKKKQKKKTNEKNFSTTITALSIPITIKIENGKVVIENFNTLLEAVKNDPNFLASFNFTNFNPQSLRYLLVGLKARASSRLKDLMINSIRQMVKDGTEDISEAELISLMNSELSSVAIRIKGPKLAELVTGIDIRAVAGGKAEIFYNAEKNNKNDMVTILVKTSQMEKQIIAALQPNLSKKMQKRLTKCYDALQEAQSQYVQDYEAAIEDVVSKLHQAKAKNAYSGVTETFIMKRDHIAKLDNQIADSYDKLVDLSDTLRDLLFEQGLDQSKAMAIQQRYLKTLQNSFYISKTVKSSNDYISGLGFLGGDLGPNLDGQLSRIADIFKSAGVPIPQEDFKWIRSAILNCFPGSVVKEHNKNLIENYLGSLMAFALFDEGGVEGQFISTFYKKYFQTMNKQYKSSKSIGDILHLYVVDGMYVPGSYVLQKTIITLQNEVLPMISEIPNTMRRGAGIMIVNPASEADIVNRPIRDNISNPNSNAWAATGANVASKIKLQILFLAGFLDVVKSINKALGNIETPT